MTNTGLSATHDALVDVGEAVEVHSLRLLSSQRVLLHRGVDGALSRKLLVKVGRVNLAHNSGLEGRHNFASVELSPVDRLEEGETSKFLKILLSRAKASLWVAVQQPLEQLLPGRSNLLGEGQASLKNVLIHLVEVLRVKRREASKHLVQQCAQGPPIYCLAMAFVEEDLRGKVLRSAAEGVCVAAGVHCFLGQTEVSQPNVPFAVQQNVFGLQIAVDNLLAVEMPQS
mmetsp:Transcript_20244/g.47322  ORF Transcript_20244/g.47322 Transcript_20244/m.47322 type:complete len:228 (-) Transcript_20244:433-1116(-)